MKKIFYWCALISFPIILLIVTAEIIATLYFESKRIYRYDPVIGWVPKSNFSYNKFHTDAAGNNYKVIVSTNKHGFRAWGDITSHKDKILFIGDSFTGDPNVSDEDSYFMQVKKILDVEIFAIGGGGYSTLQELLLLRKYVHIVNPDYFVLQFCSNDFSNNSLSLEHRSIVRNQKNIRPYFDNKIIYRLPLNHWYRYLYVHSHLFRYFDAKLQHLQYHYYGGYESLSDTSPKKRNEEITNAEETTEHLLKMMTDTMPEDTVLLSFTCNSRKHVDTKRWMRVVKSAGFIPLPSVSGTVEEAEHDGVVVRTSDGVHWSPRGHHIAGKALAREIVKFKTPAFK